MGPTILSGSHPFPRCRPLGPLMERKARVGFLSRRHKCKGENPALLRPVTERPLLGESIAIILIVVLAVTLAVTITVVLAFLQSTCTSGARSPTACQGIAGVKPQPGEGKGRAAPNTLARTTSAFRRSWFGGGWRGKELCSPSPMSRGRCRHCVSRTPRENRQVSHGPGPIKSTPARRHGHPPAGMAARGRQRGGSR